MTVLHGGRRGALKAGVCPTLLQWSEGVRELGIEVA
jgi:hypothetical protein